MSTVPDTAAGEWRRYFMLPIAAALGYATSVIHIYGLGPFIVPVSEDFGWSRTQVTFGLTIATLVQAVGGIAIGLAVDRYGPRRFGIAGIALICAAFALLGTATGEVWNWYLLWGLIALTALPVQASVWTSAVASRFHVSRGLAFAVTLCGASVAISVFPLMGTELIGQFGWRSAVLWMAVLWGAVTVPVIFIFFRGAYDGPGRRAAAAGEAEPVKRDLPGRELRESLFSLVYVRLVIASLFFTFTIIGLVVHFVPILIDRGADPLEAAGIASVIGIFSIIGRLGTGLLLDRFPGSLVGAVVFLLPVVGCIMLLADSSSYVTLAVAAAFIGLTLGSEIDVVVYLVSRHFGLRNFGGLYGGLLAALSVGTALGPLAAAAVYDETGSYAGFLWATFGMMAVASFALVTLPRKTNY